MLVRNLSELRAAGMHEAASQAIAFLTAAGVEKVWLHLDADCLDDDELMPAVDWRMAGGLSVTGAVSMARPLVRRG
jgi:arginase